MLFDAHGEVVLPAWLFGDQRVYRRAAPHRALKCLRLIAVA